MAQNMLLEVLTVNKFVATKPTMVVTKVVFRLQTSAQLLSEDQRNFEFVGQLFNLFNLVIIICVIQGGPRY